LKRLAIRGGNWNNGARAGVFALNVNNARDRTFSSVGARPASGERPKRLAHAARRLHSLKRTRTPRPMAERLNRQTIPVAPRARPFGAAAYFIIMAKTYNGLYPEIYDYASLHAAYLRARRSKRDLPEVVQFEADLESNLIQLQNELIWGMYKTGNYRRFFVREPKRREVAALPFRDRVLQHALVAVIEPIWERRFIASSHACRPRHGTHRGASQVQRYIREVKRQHGHVYVLKADISKYFASVDHAVLKQLVHRHIRCKPTLDLIDAIIDSANRAPDSLCPKGLPIGNLTSQLLANVYLHELDKFCKHTLREKYYVRYMDDFVIVHHDKAHLHRIRARIEAFLWSELRLQTNRKTCVEPITEKNPLDFVGYRIFTTHRRLRIDSIKRIKTSLRRLQRQYAHGRATLSDIRPVVCSWIAHASHADTFGLRRKLLESFPFTTATSGA